MVSALHFGNFADVMQFAISKCDIFFQKSTCRRQHLYLTMCKLETNLLKENMLICFSRLSSHDVTKIRKLMFLCELMCGHVALFQLASENAGTHGEGIIKFPVPLMSVSHSSWM